MATVHIEEHVIEVSNEDKVLFPGTGFTKGDVVHYYHRVAKWMLPYLEGRPLTLHRFPDGIHEGGFFQQQVPAYFPTWIDRATVRKKEGSITHAMVNNPATLVYLANQAVITPHVWLSRVDRPHHPDRMIFDLDPPAWNGEKAPVETVRFHPVRQAAQRVRELLDELSLPTFVMTTGSRGLHVAVPLDRSDDFEAVRTFARTAAQILVARYPSELTVEQRKKKRKGRIFVDTLRNAYGQTAVPPYALRARTGAPVATPLDWDELNRSDLHPQRYTLRNIFRRLGQKKDPWSGFDDQACALAEVRAHLAARLAPKV